MTWNLFDVLGVRPVVGRTLTAADDVPGVPRVGLVSYGFWQRHFGGDPSAVGKQIVLDDTPVTIVGVLPRSFTVARVEDAFLPAGQLPRTRPTRACTAGITTASPRSDGSRRAFRSRPRAPSSR